MKWITFCCFFAIPLAKAVLVLNNEQRLLTKLFEAYRKFTNTPGIHARPIADVSKVVQIGIGMTVLEVVNVASNDLTLTINALLHFKWRDEYLQWETEESELMAVQLRIDHHQLWTPEILLVNSVVDSGRYLFPPELGRVIDSVLSSDGTISVTMPAILRVHCRQNIEAGGLICPFRLASSTGLASNTGYQDHHLTDLRLLPAPDGSLKPKIDLISELTGESPAWTVARTWVEHGKTLKNGNKSGAVTFFLELEGSSVEGIAAPMLNNQNAGQNFGIRFIDPWPPLFADCLLCIITATIFLLPVCQKSFAPRLQIGIAASLGHAVVVMVLSGIERATYLRYFALTNFGIAVAAIFCAITIACLADATQATGPPPKWIRIILIELIGKRLLFLPVPSPKGGRFEVVIVEETKTKKTTTTIKATSPTDEMPPTMISSVIPVGTGEGGGDENDENAPLTTLTSTVTTTQPKTPLDYWRESWLAAARALNRLCLALCGLWIVVVAAVAIAVSSKRPSSQFVI